jgi:multisubunit Na+/H+ antiporter MnhB subunit
VDQERVAPALVLFAMAIDKESNGVPEVDLSRRTTKVNLWMIVGVGLFFLVTGAVVYYFVKTSGS